MLILFPRKPSLTMPGGSILIEVTWKSRRLCVGHNKMQAAAIVTLMTRNCASYYTQKYPIPSLGLRQCWKINLPQKLLNKKRAKKHLAGLYEVLKPGSYVTKSSPTTTIINEPGRSPVKVRDSYPAKFGTKN